MKAILIKMQDQLVKLVERASDFADSENEVTAEKYADIPDYLQSALDEIENAIAALE